MNTRWDFCVAVALIASASISVIAAPEQRSSTVSACGSWSSNVTVSTVCAVAQPGTVGVSSSGAFTHYSGFIGGAFIRPGTTNIHGVAVEADPDNDDDGLTDTAEVSGSAFGGHAHTDPNAADTDDDGMSDADEAAGMFDPNDPDHRLAILSLAQSNGSLRITWIGKGGDTTNAVLWSSDVVAEELTNVLHRAAYAGGDSPWFKMTNAHEWAAGGVTRGFYRVEIER